MSEADVCFYFSQLRLNQFLYFQVLEQQGIIRVESNAWLSGNTIFLCSVFLLISEDSVQPISLEAHSRLPALGSSEQALADRPPPRATSMQPDCCIAVGMQVLSLVRENWEGRSKGCHGVGTGLCLHLWAATRRLGSKALDVENIDRPSRDLHGKLQEPTVRWQQQSYLFQTSVYHEKHSICHLLYRQAILCTFFQHPWNNCFLFSDTVISVLTLRLRASHRQKCQKQRGITELDFPLDMRTEPTTPYLGLYPKLRFCFLFLTRPFAYPKWLFTLAERIGTRENAGFLSVLHLFTSPSSATLIN